MDSNKNGKERFRKCSPTHLLRERTSESSSLVRNSNEDSKYGAKKDQKGNHKGDVPYALPELSILTHQIADSIAHSELIPLLLTLPTIGNAGGMNANGGLLVQVLPDTGSLGLDGNYISETVASTINKIHHSFLRVMIEYVQA